MVSLSNQQIRHRPPRPANWKAAAPQSLPGTITFSAQTTLPPLPVPDLQSTLSRLKESLKPIAWSESEYISVVRKIDDFGQTMGPELQRRLLRRATETKNWLEKWWDDGCFLSYREPLLLNVSYYLGFDQSPSHLSNTPTARAAGITRAAMLFRQQLRKGQITPDITKDGPLCMDAYRWLFDSSRVPGEKVDWCVSYAKEGDLGNWGHIVVIRKNRIYKVDVTDNGRILSTSEIEQQFQFIYDNTLKEYPGVGVLTASHRDIWAKDYAELESSFHNSEILEAISSAAFVVVLDSSKPNDSVHHSRALWHGDVVGGVPVGIRNRWMDKPMQFVVFENGYTGLMGEHSMVDGTTITRVCDEILETLYHPTFDHGLSYKAAPKLPTPLDWQITPGTADAMKAADRAAVKLIDSRDLYFHLTSYGKAAIKKFDVSPDAWAQMIIQLAYKRLIGAEPRTGGSNEAATTRKFYRGRTEDILVATSETDAWIHSMDDGTATEICKKLFDEATKKHISLIKASREGQGIDRHLFGLQKAIKRGECLPELYDDPVFRRLFNTVVSTSAIFSKHFPVYGWGEVLPNSFAIPYMTGFDDYLQYTLTCPKTMPGTQFVEEIATAANDLYDLHIAVSQVKTKL